MSARIARVEATAVRYPEPNNDGKIRSLCLVRVETDDGIVGWGEAITGPQETSLATAFVIERRLAPIVLGRDATDVRGAWQAMRDVTYWDGNGGIHYWETLATGFGSRRRRSRGRVTCDAAWWNSIRAATRRRARRFVRSATAALRGVEAPFHGGDRGISGATVISDGATIDSLTVMDMIMALEDRFEIYIPLNLVADIHTVDQLAQAVLDLCAPCAAKRRAP